MRRWILLAVALLILVVPATASAEWFAGFYLGGAVTTKEDIKFDLFGTQVTQELDTGGSITVGARAGYWLAQFPWLGFAVDASYFSPATDIITFPLTALVMARYPLLKDDEFRDGRLQPYVGVGGGVFITKVDGSLGTVQVTDTSADPGFDMRLGAAFLIQPNIAVFGEYRFTHVSPEVELRDANLNRTTLRTDLDTHSALIGLSARW